MIIAIGSVRGPKVEALREALREIGPWLRAGADFEIVALATPSGVLHTPLSGEETMAGARNRARRLAEAAHAKRESWSYFVGMEGGLSVVRAGRGDQESAMAPARRVFLENWACVRDEQGREAYGQSGSIELPEALARRVLDDGVELAAAIDEFAASTGVRDAQGAWGVLTRGLISRQESYRLALLNAFAPFYNTECYKRAAT